MAIPIMLPARTCLGVCPSISYSILDLNFLLFMSFINSFRISACFPALLLIPTASLITTRANVRAKMNEEVIPSAKYIPVVMLITVAAWELGIPPVFIKTLRSILSVIIQLVNIFRALAIKKDKNIEKNILFEKRSITNDMTDNYLHLFK